MGKQSGLGRGLGALIPPKPISPGASSTSSSPSQSMQDVVAPQRVEQAPIRADGLMIHQIPLDEIRPNPHQPRLHFDRSQLEDLISSIQQHGVMQPIVVTPAENGYELIAGERRLRASKIAGLATIPAIVRTATEQQKLELALIENVQRQELNAIEEARAYLRLQSEFNLTQDEVGIRVGKSRPQVANIIRLLQLPQPIQDALAEGRINQSNARSLLSLPTEQERMEMFQAMLEGNFTVRQTEARIPHKRGRGPSRPQDPNLMSAEERLRRALGVKVAIKRDPNGEGEIRITFFNDEDLNGLIEKLGGQG